MFNSKNFVRRTISSFFIFLVLAVLLLPVPAKAEWVGRYISPGACQLLIETYRNSGEINDSRYDSALGVCHMHFILTDIRCRRLYGDAVGFRNGYCVPVGFEYGIEPNDTCQRMYGSQSWYSYDNYRCMDSQRMLTNADCQKTYGDNYFAYEDICILGYKPSAESGSKGE